MPCIVKPVMSSSGKGQVFLENQSDAALAWNKAVSEGRGNDARVIVEGFIDFDFEVTLLTVRHRGGTLFCRPIVILRWMVIIVNHGSHRRCPKKHCRKVTKLLKILLKAWEAGVFLE